MKTVSVAEYESFTEYDFCKGSRRVKKEIKFLAVSFAHTSEKIARIAVPVGGAGGKIDLVRSTVSVTVNDRRGTVFRFRAVKIYNIRIVDKNIVVRNHLLLRIVKSGHHKMTAFFIGRGDGT